MGKQPPPAAAPEFSDFDDALADALGNDQPRLKVDVILAALPDDQEAKVRKALASPSITAARLAKAITAIGFDVSEAAVRTWQTRNRGGRST